MLTSIQFLEEDNTTLLTMPVGAPSPSTPFFIVDVEGLAPVKANIVTTPYSSVDGSRYQHSVVGDRNIVVTVGVKPSALIGGDASTYRETLYKYFAPKSVVNMVFIKNHFASGNSDRVKMKAWVETLEASIFSNNLEMQISFICPDPYFSAYTPITINGLTGRAMDVSKFGTAPTGFLFDITLTRDAADIFIEAGFEEPIFYGSFLNNRDRLRISTETGNKFVRRTRGAIVSNELGSITKGTMSMTVDARTPTFHVNRLTAGETPHPFTIRLTPKYVGL